MSEGKKGRRWILVLVAVVLSAGLVWGLSAMADRREAQEQAADERREQREAAREERNAARLEDLREKSAEMMPEPFEGVELGMTRQEVEQVRPALQVRVGRSEDEGLDDYEENLPNGARAVYSFDEETSLLIKLQVASSLPNPEAMGTHLRYMNDRYGAPTGIWDCPATDNVTTRRFMWENERVALADVFLIYGDRIAVTLYVSSIGTMAQSLQRSQCRQISREDVLNFPINDPRGLIEEARR